MIAGWLSVQRGRRWPVELPAMIAEAREERAYRAEKLQKTISRISTAPLGNPRERVKTQIQDARGRLRTCWLAECLEWVKYIEAGGETSEFVESVLWEIRLTGLDPFRFGKDDVNEIIGRLPQSSRPQSVVDRLISRNRLEPDPAAFIEERTSPSYTPKSALADRSSIPESMQGTAISKRYQAYVEADSDTDEFDAATTAGARTLQYECKCTLKQAKNVIKARDFTLEQAKNMTRTRTLL